MVPVLKQEKCSTDIIPIYGTGIKTRTIVPVLKQILVPIIKRKIRYRYQNEKYGASIKTKNAIPVFKITVPVFKTNCGTGTRVKIMLWYRHLKRYYYHGT
jgi:hypothetical protein